MRRFILSVLLLGAIIGAGHLLNHLTARNAEVSRSEPNGLPSDTLRTVIDTSSGSGRLSEADSVNEISDHIPD